MCHAASEQQSWNYSLDSIIHHAASKQQNSWTTFKSVTCHTGFKWPNSKTSFDGVTHHSGQFGEDLVSRSSSRPTFENTTVISKLKNYLPYHPLCIPQLHQSNNVSMVSHSINNEIDISGGADILPMWFTCYADVFARVVFTSLHWYSKGPIMWNPIDPVKPLHQISIGML
jgi:hypothetical protein